MRTASPTRKGGRCASRKIRPQRPCVFASAAITALSRSGESLQTGLSQNFGDAFGIRNIVKPNHEISAGRRRDRYVAQSEHALHHAAVDFDRTHVRKFHFASMG